MLFLEKLLKSMNFTFEKIENFVENNRNALKA